MGFLEDISLTKVSHDVIPSLGARYRLTLEDSTEISVITLESGYQEIYLGENRLFTLSPKDGSVLISVLSGALPSIMGGGSGGS